MSARPKGGWDVPASYRPYAQDAPKQARFDAFLRDEAEGVRRCEGAARRPGDAVRELREFTKVAAFFSRPKHAIISDRFTSAEVQGGQGGASVGGLASPPGGGGTKPAAPPAGAAQAPPQPATAGLAEHDPAHAAASMGMFGQLTRTTSKWQPEALLCKRFNLPCPAVNMTAAERRPTSQSATFNDALLPVTQLAAPTASGAGTTATWANAAAAAAQPPPPPPQHRPQRGSAREAADSFLASLQVEHTAIAIPTRAPPPPPPLPSATSPSSAATPVAPAVGAPQPETMVAEQDEEPPPRPPMALFKAIFQDSDDEEEESAAVSAELDAAEPEHVQHAAAAPPPPPPAALRMPTTGDAPAPLASWCAVSVAPLQATDTAGTGNGALLATRNAPSSNVWADSGSSDDGSEEEAAEEEGAHREGERRHKSDKAQKRHKKEKKHKRQKKEKKEKEKRKRHRKE